MKKHITWIAAGLLLLPAVTLAAEFRTGEQPSVGSGERIQNDVYMVGGGVTSAGTIVGDLIAGGGNVVVSGDVSADVIVGGGNVTIMSNVGDDLRVGGGNIVIQGRVAGDAIIGGGQISVGGPGIGGDVAMGGGMIRIDAPVAGSVRIGGGNIYLNGPINGNVQIEAETLTLGRGAVLNGTLTYKASKVLTQEPGAVVKGEIKFTEREEASGTAFAAIFSLFMIGKFLALLLAAMVVGLMFGRYAKEAVERAAARPFFEMGRGLLFLIATPIIAMILCVTVIGIPLGILGFLSFAAAMIFSWIIAPIILGSYLYGYFSKHHGTVSWQTILLGVFVYEVLELIPFIGWLAQALTLLISLGVMVGIKLQLAREWR